MSGVRVPASLIVSEQVNRSWKRLSAVAEPVEYKLSIRIVQNWYAEFRDREQD